MMGQPAFSSTLLLSFLQAAQKNDVHQLQALLGGCSDLLNARDENGMTALITSAHRGHIESVTFLLSAGARPGLRDKWGNTALFAARNNSGSRARTVESLLQKEAARRYQRCQALRVLRETRRLHSGLKEPLALPSTALILTRPKQGKG